MYELTEFYSIVPSIPLYTVGAAELTIRLASGDVDPKEYRGIANSTASLCCA